MRIIYGTYPVSEIGLAVVTISGGPAALKISFFGASVRASSHIPLKLVLAGLYLLF